MKFERPVHMKSVVSTRFIKSEFWGAVNAEKGMWVILRFEFCYLASSADLSDSLEFFKDSEV